MQRVRCAAHQDYLSVKSPNLSGIFKTFSSYPFIVPILFRVYNRRNISRRTTVSAQSKGAEIPNRISAPFSLYRKRRMDDAPEGGEAQKEIALNMWAQSLKIKI